MPYRFLIILSLLHMSSACKSTATSSKHQSTGLKYLALGDSYTIGQSVGASDTYPQQLVNALNEAGAHFEKPRIIAQTGWTTADLQRAMDHADLNDAQFDLVSLLIGVNNEFQGKSLAAYETEFTTLLQRAIRLAHNDPRKVFVLSIPDYGFTPFGEEQRSYVSPRIDQFNAAAARITESLHVAWFDITPVSRTGLDQPELGARDGLHPSAQMYAQWVAQILPEVRKIVR
jgi:acyl-CoA thioesterase-1